MIVEIRLAPSETRRSTMNKTPSGWVVAEYSTWSERWSALRRRRYVKTYDKALRILLAWQLEETERRIFDPSTTRGP